MARSDDEVVDILRDIYRASFGGKARQRFLISWPDLRSLYGFGALYQSRFERLVERGAERGAYLFDLGEGTSGHMVAVIGRKTVDRWRKVPRHIIREHLPPATEVEDIGDDGENGDEE